MSFNINRHKELTEVTTRQDTSLGIMKWGEGNSFPKTLENLIKKSPNAYPAVKRTAKFLRGGSFDGEDEIINSSGLTLGGLADILSLDYAIYEAFSIHANYNLKYKVSSINTIRVSDLRFKEYDELNFSGKIGYHYNWGKNSEVVKTIESTPTRNKIKWFNRFNPKAVPNQVDDKNGGVTNYLGQILYVSNEGGSSYPIPPLQPSINFVLADIENSILVRKETATGFINSYIFKTTLDAEDPTLDEIKFSFEEAQGARGSGKIIVITGVSPEEINSSVLEEIGSGDRAGIIESSKTAHELCKEVISGTYLIPPALAGIDQTSGFSGKDLEEAYVTFNAITQGGRDLIQTKINEVLRYSVFETKEISLTKLKLDVEEKEDGKEEGNKVVETNKD